MSEQALTAQKLLAEVPRVGYDVHLCPFPGSLYSCLHYLGDPCDYDYLMGVSGAAFRRFWQRDDGGNIDIANLGNEPFRRLFAALGYTWNLVPPQKERMLEAIRQNIDSGKPVIVFGIIGAPEAGIVTGYEQNGEVLYGWSYFQEDRSQTYRKSNWFEEMYKVADRGLIVIGPQQTTRPLARDVLLDSLCWAIEIERTPQRSTCPDHAAGLAAYDGWANALEVDSDYPVDDANVLAIRAMVYGDQVVMLEERHSAARFLRQAAHTLPELSHPLNCAAALYDQVADQVAKVWLWGGDMGRPVQQGLSSAEARRSFAVQIRAARALECQAVEQLERALAIGV